MLLTVVVFLIILGLLVFVHEFGHFITAKKMGMKVEEFGFGFPPRLIKLFHKDGTDYTLNWIPLGGFVKIKGEAGDHLEDEDSFSHKKPWQRFIVLIAGVTMNMILGWVLLSIGFMIGMPQVIDSSSPSATVTAESIQIVSVDPNSAAAEAGIKPGDKILQIDGDKISSIAQLQDIVKQSSAEVTLLLDRGGKQIDLKITPRPLSENGDKVLGVGLVKTGIVSYPFFQAIIEGGKATVYLTWQIVSSFAVLLKNLVTGQQVSADIAGPVGIAVLTGQVMQLGFVYLLQFAALLSINLAIINILPIPALDGGRILFLAIEKIRNRPVDQKLEAFIHNIGFILLMILLLFVTVRDIGKFNSAIFSVLKKIF